MLLQIIHHHRHGADTWLVETDIEPTVDQAVNRLNIDFEPDMGEYIEMIPEQIEKITDWD